ncbi:MAG: hypothetical protein HZB67_05690, partial [Candidatus Aenigmarchaeota archaeon]|nr:hypothetical protein [Candidatus Aenigmarchaeota archaeon]
NFVEGIGALVVVILFLVVAWVVSKILVHILKRFLEEIQLEEKFREHGIHDALLGFNFTHVLAMLLKLTVYAAFLGIAAETVNLKFMTSIVLWFVGYVPLLVQGIVILLFAMLAADYVTDHIKKTKVIPFANFVGVFFEVFVVYTAIVMAIPLILPNADTEILRFTYYIILGAIGFALALGLGIALGLGLRDTVAKVAEKKRPEIEKLV